MRVPGSRPHHLTRESPVPLRYRSRTVPSADFSGRDGVERWWVSRNVHTRLRRDPVMRTV